MDFYWRFAAFCTAWHFDTNDDMKFTGLILGHWVNWDPVGILSRVLEHMLAPRA
jgi:hypothetical protein